MILRLFLRLSLTLTLCFMTIYGSSMPRALASSNSSAADNVNNVLTWPVLPIPDEGEALFLAVAQYDGLANLQVAFLRTADGLRICELNYYIPYMVFTFEEGSWSYRTIHERERVEFTDRFSLTEEGLEVSDGQFTLSDLKFHGDHATANLDFTYEYQYKNQLIHIPFGKAELSFVQPLLPAKGWVSAVVDD